MVSMWWLICAFLMGGLVGLLVFSLIGMASNESERTISVERRFERDGLIPLKLEKYWGTKDRWNANLR